MKTIRTAILITVVLFALSSCDAVLEIFYPEFATPKGDENVVSIWAEFDMYPAQISGDSQYIYGQLIDTKSLEIVREVAVEPFWHWIEEKNSIYWHLEGNIDFFDVPDGEYEVFIWLEQSGDGKPYGTDEPSAYAMRNDNDSITFTFPSAAASNGWLYGEVLVPLR